VFIGCIGAYTYTSIGIGIVDAKKARQTCLDWRQRQVFPRSFSHVYAISSVVCMHTYYMTARAAMQNSDDVISFLSFKKLYVVPCVVICYPWHFRTRELFPFPS
jgi:hypothetical protein